MEDKLKILQEYLKKRGMKSTHQRDIIVREFFKHHEHIDIETILDRVRKVEPSIGYATVYRTMKLLTECGLSIKREFGGSACFEQQTSAHHDHMICLECGKIIEFKNDEIERLQVKACKEKSFKLLRHKMELYGFCDICHNQKKTA